MHNDDSHPRKILESALLLYVNLLRIEQGACVGSEQPEKGVKDKLLTKGGSKASILVDMGGRSCRGLPACQ
jgi:hypothetical protein